MSSRRNRILVVALPVGAILLAALLIRMRPEPPRTPSPERIPSVTTVAVAPGNGPLPVVGNGTVVPRAEVDLAPQVGGRVEWVSPSLQSGGQFAAGEVLVRIEEADFANAVEQARAQVAQDSVAVLQAAEEARIARDEYERFQAREGGAGAPGPLVLREPQLQAARAVLARSSAQLADSELALERTRLRAPFTGRVRSENVDAGSFAAPGQALARIYASDMVEVVVSLSARDAAVIPGLWGFRAGSSGGRVPATVIADYGGRRYAWEGYVDRAPAALDERSRTIDVVVRVENPFRPGTPLGAAEPGEDPPPLLVGQFVEVQIQGRSGDFHILPRRALQPGNEVWMVADSTVRRVPVEVLQQAGDSVFVTGDVRPGERVIVAGISLATDGMRVRPATPGAATGGVGSAAAPAAPGSPEAPSAPGSAATTSAPGSGGG
jgi:RND family efflux transporter MFP subunit